MAKPKVKLPTGHVQLRHIDTLTPDPDNARTHSPAQVVQLAGLMERFGYTNPMLVDEVIRAGNGRYAGLQLLRSQGKWPKLPPTEEHPEGWQLPEGMVPVVDCTGWSEEQRRAYALADNQSALNAGWDEDRLRAEVQALAAMDFDMPLLGFDEAEMNRLLGLGQARTPGALAERWGVPPFTVLDTRQGYWVERRQQWLQLTGNLSATKESVLGHGTIIDTINQGSSNFDPVLAEVMMRWFCPAGGWVLDPFGGEQTKGVVAGQLGLHYRAVEIRQDQVDVNRVACERYGGLVRYECGDSEDIAQLLPLEAIPIGFDLCFTSPPYYDLEVYSANDMSALGSYEEFMAKYERVFAACATMLRDDSWLVVKVGEIRDKATGIYRGFVPDNVALFRRLGLVYYGELVLVNAAGTAPQRAERSMRNRKPVKLHQNVLVFCKGDPLRAAERCGACTGVDLGAADA